MHMKNDKFLEKYVTMYGLNNLADFSFSVISSNLSYLYNKYIFVSETVCRYEWISS